MEKKPEMNKEPEEKKEADRSELTRSAKFVLFSISAGVVEIGVFTLLQELTDWDYWACYLPALVLSVVWNFTLNREYTFRSANNVPVAMLKVAAYYAACRGRRSRISCATW